MNALVWVSEWEIQCCGEPFAVGERVDWTLRDDPDREWLAAALGPELAQSVSHVESHHNEVPEEVSPVRARVLGIRRAYCRYAAAHGGDSHPYPVPGSAVLTEVDRADGWEAEMSGLHFNGYLVELDVFRAGPA
ncbi:DUF6578 domain-containing protein [Saccharopolyspora sp. NPDC003752]